MWIQRFLSSPPASSSTTLMRGSSLSRAATAQPAEPAPITMKSASIASLAVLIASPPPLALFRSVHYSAAHAEAYLLVAAAQDVGDELKALVAVKRVRDS